MTGAGQPAQMPSSKRILVATHSTWDADFGLPRGLMGMMQQLAANGHSVEKYSEEEAFPDPEPFRRLRYPFTVALFQRKLLNHIRERGGDYDLVIADHQLFPFEREKYQFEGRLAARSQGILHFYERYMRRQPSGRRAGLPQRLGWWAGGGVGAADRTFRTVDHIYLNNTDELAYVRDDLGHGEKCVLLHNAISADHRRALVESCDLERRLSSPWVAFVGLWSVRKGLREIPGIVRSVRKRRPEARFRLLGTHYPVDQIRPRLDAEDRDAIEVVRTFDNAELPERLADVRVGLFPSHVEGFGIGLLEMAAAGIPSVAWDVPGPRDILGSLPGLPLIPAGDVETTAAAILRLLGCDRVEYTALSRACMERSRRFSWEQVAATIEDVTLRDLDRP